VGAHCHAIAVALMRLVNFLRAGPVDLAINIMMVN